MLISKGWDIKNVQFWLGHRDVQTTLNIYSHFNRQKLNACGNDLAEMTLEAGELFV